MRVLVADDDANVRTLLAMIIQESGNEPTCVSNGKEALEAIARIHPHLVVLDVMMPKIDGFETCRRIRELDPSAPVLFLSAKGDVIDRKMGLRMGADDYLAKPFDEEEFLLRAEALMRRSASTSKETPSPDRVIALGQFQLDFSRLTFNKRGIDVGLTTKEFQIASLLATHQGEVFSADRLVKMIWDDEFLDASASIPVYVRHIRSKIEDDPSHPRHIRTIRGSGYYFEP